MGALSNNLGKKEVVGIDFWDLKNQKKYSCLKDFHIEGIQFIEFNEKGNLILTIGFDEFNTLAIYDWINGSMIFNSHVNQAQMNGICWIGDKDFVTVGKGYVLFWLMDGKNAVPYLGDFKLKQKEFFDEPLCISCVRLTVSGGGSSPFKQKYFVLIGTKSGNIQTWDT